MQTLEERFFAKVEKGDDGCWSWTGAKTPLGYGKLWDGTRHEYAHRVAYRLFRGPVTQGLDVCHTCDKPGCVNPWHLWLGTHQQNMADRDAKGRGVGSQEWLAQHQEMVERRSRAIRQALRAKVAAGWKPGRKPKPATTDLQPSNMR